LRVRVERRLPALSSFRGHRVAQDSRWRGVGEARHVDADLRQYDVGGELTHSRHRREQAGARSDRRQGFSYFSIHILQRLLEGCDELQMELQEPSVMRGNVAAERLDEQRALLTGVALSEVCEPLRVSLPGDARREHRPTALSEHSGQDAPELEIGVFEGLLDPQAVLGDLAHQLLAGACEIPRLLD